MNRLMMAEADKPVPDLLAVDQYLFGLQEKILSQFESFEPERRFLGQLVESPAATTRPKVLEGGDTFEKAAVMYTRVKGERLPASVSARRPEIAGSPFEAVSLSLITHPENPFVPTAHMNLRFFLVQTETPIWHFGGGFDLTPVYPSAADAIFWHRHAKHAVEAVYPNEYESLKKACDDYFTLPHRKHQRGVGGLFFDDWTLGGFATCFQFIQSLGEAFLHAYMPIVRLRRLIPWNASHKRFQRLRRGRYAEFNLAIDRGTKYGLESGRRTESVLASLPPQVDWAYQWKPEPETREALLEQQYLVARNWL